MTLSRGIYRTRSDRQPRGNCPICGGSLEGLRSTAKYCGRECANKGAGLANRRYASDEERRAAKKASIRKTRYGITPEQFDELLRYQGGRCAICGRPFLAKPTARTPHVDHNHKTGEIRGLLDSYCNRNVLAALKDNADRARAAAAYLDNPPARAAFAATTGSTAP